LQPCDFPPRPEFPQFATAPNPPSPRPTGLNLRELDFGHDDKQDRKLVQRFGCITSCSRASRQFGEESKVVFAGLTGKGLSYLSASETQLPSFQHPPAFQFTHPTSPPSPQLIARRTSRLSSAAYPTSLSFARRASLPGQVAVNGALHIAQHVDWDLDILRHYLLASSHRVFVSPPSPLPRPLARSCHFDLPRINCTLPGPTTTPARFPSETPKV